MEACQRISENSAVHMPLNTPAHKVTPGLTQTLKPADAVKHGDCCQASTKASRGIGSELHIKHQALSDHGAPTKGPRPSRAKTVAHRSVWSRSSKLLMCTRANDSCSCGSRPLADHEATNFDKLSMSTTPASRSRPQARSTHGLAEARCSSDRLVFTRMPLNPSAVLVLRASTSTTWRRGMFARVSLPGSLGCASDRN